MCEDGVSECQLANSSGPFDKCPRYLHWVPVVENLGADLADVEQGWQRGKGPCLILRLQKLLQS
jgi:hypothetical protein